MGNSQGQELGCKIQSLRVAREQRALQWGTMSNIGGPRSEWRSTKAAGKQHQQEHDECDHSYSEEVLSLYPQSYAVQSGANF